MSLLDLRFRSDMTVAKNIPAETVVVTGAFSYTGKCATRILLDRGYRIRTLTYHPERENPFGDRVQIFSCNFENPKLA